MIDTYIPVLVLLVLSGGFAVSMLLASILLGPKRYSEVKDDPFECGTIGTGEVTQRMSVKFFVVAMVFILFDIEVVFLYPWAVTLNSLGWFGFWAAMPFIALLTLGLVYEWRRGVLNWS